MEHFKDVFISYGRKESLVFCQRLYEQLQQKGINAWFDFVNIPKGDDFQLQIDNGIQSAHNFIYVISPHANASSYCLKELELAISLGKRIIPILHIERDLDKIHPEIGKDNWIYCRQQEDDNLPLEEWLYIDDFDAAFTDLLSLINSSEKDFIEQHTAILDKALLWERNDKNTHELLVGKERTEAEKWLLREVEPPNQLPCEPCLLMVDFLCESRKNAENLLTDVFISFASEDKSIKEQIDFGLSRKLVTTWNHNKDIRSGENYDVAIKSGIENADNLMFFITKESVLSEWCLKELDYALSLNKRVIPLLIEKVPQEQFPVSINEIQYVDFTDNIKEGDFDQDISSILQELKNGQRYLNQHKTFLTLALRWERKGYKNSLLLRGNNLQNAKLWLEKGMGAALYRPTVLQEKFINESQRLGGGISIEVFLSYSRKDSDFSRKLNNLLQQDGHTTWFDQESIAEGTDFEFEINKGIEAAENFVFLLSPDSLESPYCQKEVDYAVKQGKRIFTVLVADIDAVTNIPYALAHIQRIDCLIDFEMGYESLKKSLTIDRAYVSKHTKWQTKALEWEQKEFSKDLLVTGEEYELAHSFLQNSTDKKPQVTDLQKDFIEASHVFVEKVERQKKMYRQMTVFGVLALVLTTIFGLMQWYQSANGIESMSVKSLAARAERIASSNPRLAQAMAIEAFNQSKKLGDDNINFYRDELLTVAKKVANKKSYYTTIVGELNFFDMDFSPNEKLIVTGGYRSNTLSLKLWDVEGNEISEMTRSLIDVAHLAVTFDDDSTVSLRYDHVKEVYSLEGTQLERIDGLPLFITDDEVPHLYAQDSSLKVILNSASDGFLELEVMDTQTEESIFGFPFSDGHLDAVRFSKDKSTLLVSNRGGGIFLFDLKAGEYLDFLQNPTFFIPQWQPFTSITELSKTGRYFATSVQEKGKILIWDLQQLEIRDLSKTDYICDVFWKKSIEGGLNSKRRFLRYISADQITTSDVGYYVYAEIGDEHHMKISDTTERYHINLSPTGNHWLGTINTTTQLLDLSAHLITEVKGIDGCFDPTGKCFLTRSGYQIFKWDFEGNLLGEYTGAKFVTSMFFSKDKIYYTDDENDHVHVLSDELQSLETIIPMASEGVLWSVNPDQSLLIVGSMYNSTSKRVKLDVVDVDGEIQEVITLNETVLDVIFDGPSTILIHTAGNIEQKVLVSQYEEQVDVPIGLQREVALEASVFEGKVIYGMEDFLYLKRLFLNMVLAVLLFLVAGSLLNAFDDGEKLRFFLGVFTFILSILPALFVEVAETKNYMNQYVMVLMMVCVPFTIWELFQRLKKNIERKNIKGYIGIAILVSILVFSFVFILIKDYRTIYNDDFLLNLFLMSLYIAFFYLPYTMVVSGYYGGKKWKYWLGLLSYILSFGGLVSIFILS